MTTILHVGFCCTPSQGSTFSFFVVVGTPGDDSPAPTAAAAVEVAAKSDVHPSDVEKTDLRSGESRSSRLSGDRGGIGPGGARLGNWLIRYQGGRGTRAVTPRGGRGGASSSGASGEAGSRGLGGTVKFPCGRDCSSKRHHQGCNSNFRCLFSEVIPNLPHSPQPQKVVGWWWWYVSLWRGRVKRCATCSTTIERTCSNSSSSGGLRVWWCDPCPTQQIWMRLWRC